MTPDLHACTSPSRLQILSWPWYPDRWRLKKQLGWRTFPARAWMHDDACTSLRKLAECVLPEPDIAFRHLTAPRLLHLCLAVRSYDPKVSANVRVAAIAVEIPKGEHVTHLLQALPGRSKKISMTETGLFLVREAGRSREICTSSLLCVDRRHS